MSRRRTEPRRWFATSSGRRYHASPYCTGLNAAETAGSTVVALTTAQVRARALTPCAACSPTPMLRSV